MDSRKTAATSELQSLLEHRRRIAEGGPRNDAFSAPGRLSRDNTSGYYSTARFPVTSVTRTLNGSTSQTFVQSVQTRVIKPQPFASHRITTAVKAFDGRKGHVDTTEDRVASMSQKQEERMGKGAQNGSAFAVDERFLLLNQGERNSPDEQDSEREKAGKKAMAQGAQGDANLLRETELLREEVERLKKENAELKEAPKKLEQQLQELRAEREASQASPSAGGGSESRLRSVMTSGKATVDELRSAIASVEAVLDEARRELDRKQLRERRAAFEHLYHAIDKADEDMLEQAIQAAQAADVDDEDILKAQNKLLELQMMSPEERAARAARQRQTQQKKDAFQMVKKDDAEGLAALLDHLEEGVSWEDWRDYAGRTLVRCAADLRAPNAQVVIAERAKAKRNSGAFLRQQTPPREAALLSTPPGAISGADSEVPRKSPGEVSITAMSPQDTRRASAPALLVKAADFVVDDPAEDDAKPEISNDEAEKLKAQALRAVVQDDCPSLADVLKIVRRTVWSRWENKAGKDLLTLSQERGSSMAYSMLAKSLGMVKEVKREFYEERQTVWVFVNGDIQPRRATVMEDTPEECDDVLLEFWDGDDPPERVERCLIRAMWS